MKQKNSDWYDSTALGWAIGLKKAEASLLLLERGADPYHRDAAGNECLGSALQKLDGHLGGARDFFPRLHQLCLAKSPPACDWSQLSVSERLRTVLATW